jgi:[ribosomal protein S18]-alanine N-acetyltransferase
MMAIARKPEWEPIDDIELTRMRRRHLRKVLSIEARVYPRPWSPTLFLSEMAQKHTRSYLVARYDGEVVGYAGMMFMAREAHVTNIAVDPSFHGRKVASRLLIALITEAIARGCELVSLEVRTSNLIAQSMYEKFGFAEVGRRKGYYIETNEDAIVMEISDLASTDYRVLLQALREEIEGPREVPGV